MCQSLSLRCSLLDHLSLDRLSLGRGGAGIAVFAGSLLLSGCPAGAALDDAAQVIDHYSQLDLAEGEYCNALPLFEEHCGTSSCHGSVDGAPVAGGVDLVTPGVAERLLDVAPIYPLNPECATTPRLLIDSASLEASYLVQKVEDVQDCGLKMPYLTTLSTEQVLCVRSWVEGVIAEGGSGAPPATGGMPL